MKRHKGNVADLLITGICILAMTAVMLSYMHSVELIQQKTQVGQLGRKYILRMETVGYLTAEDRTALMQELSDLGVTQADCEGTTLSPVSFGEPIALRIRGKLKGEYAFEEYRASTAKN